MRRHYNLLVMSPNRAQNHQDHLVIDGVFESRHITAIEWAEQELSDPEMQLWIAGTGSTAMLWYGPYDSGERIAGWHKDPLCGWVRYPRNDDA